MMTPGTVVEAVHLDKQLIQRLLTLVVPSERKAPALADGVELVDKDEAGRLFTGLLEHVPDPGSPDADEHLHELGPADLEEGNFCLTGDRLGEKGLSRSGGTDEENAPGNLSADGLVFLSGLSRKSTISSSSALASSTPATSLNVTPVSPSATSFALFSPKDITPMPVLPILFIEITPDEHEEDDREQPGEEGTRPGLVLRDDAVVFDALRIHETDEVRGSSIRTVR